MVTPLHEHKHSEIMGVKLIDFLGNCFSPKSQRILLNYYSGNAGSKPKPIYHDAGSKPMQVLYLDAGLKPKSCTLTQGKIPSHTLT